MEFGPFIRSIYRNYRIETGVAISIIITIIVSLIMFYRSDVISSGDHPIIISDSLAHQSNNTSITVDIEGAVRKPGIYKLPLGSHISDLLNRSGGFTTTADTKYVAKTINLAQSLKDEDKLYVPALDDVLPEIQSTDTHISINTASTAELTSLPRIGETTAQKIVAHRPYTSLDELVSTKVLSQSLYDQLRDLIKL